MTGPGTGTTTAGNVAMAMRLPRLAPFAIRSNKVITRGVRMPAAAPWMMR